MEVWALEGYGAAHTLREILTIKSDDVKGRNLTYAAIIKGQKIPTPGIPESFKLLTKELQGLSITLRLLDNQGNQKEIASSNIYDAEPREDEAGDENSTLVNNDSIMDQIDSITNFASIEEEVLASSSQEIEQGEN